MIEKTHWLQNANKNYLGHWDLPTDKDLILTIESAKWEDVKNPTNGQVKSLRIVRFKGNYKPLICNQTNAKSILKSTGIRYMEDIADSKIALFISEYYDRKEKETIDAIRIRDILKSKIELKPNDEQWNKAKKAIELGSITKIDALKKLKDAFTISKDNETLFLK